VETDGTAWYAQGGHFIKPAFFSMKPDGKPAWHDAYQYAILEEEWFSKQ
jgi:hypothetical protein